MNQRETHEIAIILPPWYSHLLDVVEGILSIHSVRKYCKFRNFISQNFSEPVEFPKGYKPDGIIVSYDCDEFEATWLEALNVPIVNMFPSMRKPHPCVYTSRQSLVNMALDHFVALGFEEISYLYTTNKLGSNILEGLFMEECKKRHLPYWSAGVPDGIISGAWHRLEEESPGLNDKLVNATRRTGIYSDHDLRGRLLADYCTDLGIRIPEQIGILGRFDSITSRLCTPELSSIVVPSKEIGAHTIQLLVEMIEGHEPESDEIVLDITELRVRQSTVNESNPDMVVIQARSLIRESSCKGLTVDEITQSLKISRSTFEKRYRALTGVSPAQDIRNTRVAKARELLLTTKKTISEVASEIGFNDPRPFVVFFKREVGENPGEFRKQCGS